MIKYSSVYNLSYKSQLSNESGSRSQQNMKLKTDTDDYHKPNNYKMNTYFHSKKYLINNKHIY